MRRPPLIAATSVVAISAALLACVDLFHGTQFDTLCTTSPSDPACGTDAAVAADVAAGDAADAARPRLDFCAWSSGKALDQALRACAWLGACEGPLGESAFGPCVVRAQLAFNCAATPTLRPIGAVDAFWSCLASVASCGDVDRCVFPEGVQPCIAVNGGSSDVCGTKQNAGVRIRCAGPAGRAAGIEPCVMLGKTCATESAASSTAQCTGPKGFGCSTSDCSGSAVVDCPAGLDRGIDCAGFGGGTCAKATVSATSCEPGRDAGSCTVETAPTCNGSAVTLCANGKETWVDCSAVGLPCDVTELVAGYELTAACIDRGPTACNKADSCSNGATLESCGRGATFSVNCASLGLGACKLDASGRASCTAPTN